MSSSSGPVAVSPSTSSKTLQASNARRSGLLVFNTDTGSNLFLTYGPTSTTTLFTVRIQPGVYWEMPYGGDSTEPLMPYDGIVSAIWDGTPTGGAMVTETQID